jgi:hypothetical protein
MGLGMGIVIDFTLRDAVSSPRGDGSPQFPAQVVILPVIRVERHDDAPPKSSISGGEQNRKRRRRVLPKVFQF